VLPGVLDLAGRLVGLALGLQVTVAGGIADRLLAVSLELLGLVLCLVLESHDRSVTGPGPAET
jgi:hypothetical protein